MKRVILIAIALMTMLAACTSHKPTTSKSLDELSPRELADLRYAMFQENTQTANVGGHEVKGSELVDQFSKLTDRGKTLAWISFPVDPRQFLDCHGAAEAIAILTNPNWREGMDIPEEMSVDLEFQDNTYFNVGPGGAYRVSLRQLLDFLRDNCKGQYGFKFAENEMSVTISVLKFSAMQIPEIQPAPVILGFILGVVLTLLVNTFRNRGRLRPQHP